jgi:hypothetical protein
MTLPLPIQSYNLVDIEGVGASYAIVQYFPFYMRVTAARSGHVRTQLTAKVDENYYAQHKKICDGELNPRPQL